MSTLRRKFSQEEKHAFLEEANHRGVTVVLREQCVFTVERTA